MRSEERVEEEEGNKKKKIESERKMKIFLEILDEVEQGVKTKNLAAHLDISLSAIEKRKKQLRDIFEVKDAQDETLLKEARKKGFV